MNFAIVAMVKSTNDSLQYGDECGFDDEETSSGSEYVRKL